MNRAERTPIIEPVMLILKQRTGIASILAFIVVTVMIINGQSFEAIMAMVSPIFVYIGKQTIVDANESSGIAHEKVSELNSRIVELKAALGDGVQAEDMQEMQDAMDVLFSTVDYLMTQFEETPEDES